MKDINGQELREGSAALLLCEVIAIEPAQIVVRVMNSDMQLAVGTKHDEVLGGDVADSELTALSEVAASEPDPIKPCAKRHEGNRITYGNFITYDDQADGLKAWPME
jgi:hypothetical protein